jgi:hypothetical protein
VTEQEFGLFTVDRAARTVRGILVPWEELSRISQTGNKPMKFRAGDVRIPRDVTIVTLNKQHDRFSPIGRLTKAEPVGQGLFSEFTIADTEDGDAWLADHGNLVRLSPELKDIRTRGDYGTATLTGAALVTEGAWASAGLFAIGDVTEDDDEDEEDTEGDEPDETDPAPAEPDEEPDEEPDKEEEDAVAEATAPATMLAARRKTEAPTLTKAGFFAARHQAQATGDRSALSPYIASASDAGMFALTNVKYDTAGGLAADAGLPSGWLGELWAGRHFQRTIVPLLSQGTLTGIRNYGWVWTTKPAMAAWAGNKSAVPSTAPVVAQKEFFTQRIAGGNDLAREYYDLPGGQEIVDSYIQAMVDSYAVVSDQYALTQLLAGAAAFTPGTATANKGLFAVIDGALAVVAAQATPSFAVVAPNVFRDILGTPHSTALEYFDGVANLNEVTGTGFTIVPDARLTAGQVLVGAKEAATAWELPGSPIRVSAIHSDLGGIDETLFGYISVGVTYPAAVVKGTVTITAADEAATAEARSTKK